MVDKKQKDYINFVLTGDGNYVIPLVVAMTSILHNLDKSRTARFFVLTTDFNDANIEDLNKIKKIRPCEVIHMPLENYLHLFKKIDPSTSKLADYISLATYYRLLMFKILPEDVEKCFYIDGDMIIDHDLSQIYDELTNQDLASVVVEIYAMQFRKKNLRNHFKMPEFSKFAKMPMKYPYFNAGFMLLNIKKAKEEDLYKKAFDFLKNNPHPDYVDQDVLNSIIGQQYTEKINYLDPSYNVFCQPELSIVYDDAYYPQKVIRHAIRHPKVYHYGGANKPWINNLITNYYNVWWKYYKLSPFKNTGRLKKQKNNFYKFILSSKKFSKKTVYYLFGLIPCCRVKCWGRKTKYYIFGFIPIVKHKKIKS